MTRTRFGVAAAFGVTALGLFLLAGRAGTQGSASAKVLPVLSTTDGIGYIIPCG